MQMSEEHRRLWDAGLPKMAMGHQIRDLRFQQVKTATGLQATLTTAIEQQRILIAICNAAAPGGQAIEGTLMLYSEGSDAAAMQCAGAVFETLYPRYGGKCMGVNELRLEPYDADPVGVYLIHGISDQMHPNDAAALRSYRYRRDGSLFLLVASSPDDIDSLITKTLRIFDAHLFALDQPLPSYHVYKETR